MNKYQLLFLITFLLFTVFMFIVSQFLKINKNRERIKFNIIKSNGLYKNTFNFEGTIFNKGNYPIYIDAIRIIDKKTKELKEQVPCYSYCILPKEKLSFNLNRFGMRSHIVEVITELGNSRKASLNI